MLQVLEVALVVGALVDAWLAIVAFAFYQLEHRKLVKWYYRSTVVLEYSSRTRRKI